MRPRVSIALPVYNGARYLAESIESVLAQTFVDLELIVADNASTDGSLEVARAYAERDPRIVVLASDRNRGAAWNYNRTVAAARGELFRWHAHDDRLLPTAVERCIEALDGDPEAVLAYTYTRFVDEHGRVVRDYADDLGAVQADPVARLRATMCNLTFCNAVFGVVRHDVLTRTACIAPFPGSDVTLLYELALLGRLAVVPQYLFERRPGSSTKANPTTRSLRVWFDPDRSHPRPVAVDHAVATFRAIQRSDLGVRQEAGALVCLGTVWPGEYARRRVRRRRRARPAGEAAPAA